jgi:hypothetical protein
MGFLNFLGKKEKKRESASEEEIPPPPAPSGEENQPISKMELPALDEGIRPMPEFKNFDDMETDNIKLPEISELEPEDASVPKFDDGPFLKEEKEFKFEEPETEEPESGIEKEDTSQKVKLMEFEEEAPETKLGDEIVPDELPPIKKGPEIKMKKIEEAPEEIKTAYLHPEGPVFVRAVNLRTVLEEINSANNQLKKIPAQLKRIEEEEKLFEEWRTSLEGTYRRLNAIDRTLYLVNR